MSGTHTDLAGLNVDAEEFLAGVLGAVAQPIWVVDHEDVIRYANAAAVNALGYERADELSGRRSHETIHYQHPDGTPYPAEECPMLRPRATGETVASELDWFFRRDGSMFPVSYVSVPLGMRDGRGAVVAFNDIEERLSAERALRDRDAALTGQHASLRRVATLGAVGAASAAVFAAVAEEVGRVTGLPLVALWRYEADETATVIGEWSELPHPFRAGTRWPLGGPTICTRVLETGGPARIDDFSEVPGEVGDAARETGICACAGAPIIVDGDVWGAMSADSIDREPLPAHIEYRLAEFTELVAAAISNAARQEQLARLADEQAALRRVATLVARSVAPAEIFAAVVREVAELFGVSGTQMGRYDADGAVTAIASWSRVGASVPVGTSSPLDTTSVSGLVFTTRRPARKEHYDDASAPVAAISSQFGIRSAVAAPIMVGGALWGVMIASSSEDQPPAADMETRMAAFTELVATAISNTEARSETARLADEQAALRRVATLVVQGVPSSELFGAVAEEVGTLLGADFAGMIRYENDRTVHARGHLGRRGRAPGRPGSLAGAGRRPGDDHRDGARTRSHRRLGPDSRADRRHGPERTPPQLLGRQPDLRGGASLGRPGRPLETGGAAPGGRRVAPAELHRAGRHSRGKCRGPRGSAAPRRRAGGSAARGDARRPRLRAG